jgi:hypothetical protein
MKGSPKEFQQSCNHKKKMKKKQKKLRKIDGRRGARLAGH